MKPAYYATTINGKPADVYDVLRAFDVSCPALAHAVKKLLRCGKGHKTSQQDKQEAIESVRRSMELDAASDDPVRRRILLIDAIRGVKRTAIVKTSCMGFTTISQLVSGARPITEAHWKKLRTGFGELGINLEAPSPTETAPA